MKSASPFGELAALTAYFQSQLKLLPCYELTDPSSNVVPSSSDWTEDREQDEAETQIGVTFENGLDQTSLKKRLRDKIEGIRKKTGSAKRKQKSAHEWKMKRDAERQKRRRRAAARTNTQSKIPNKPSLDTPITSMTFSELKGASSGSKSSQKGKTRLAEKFHKLNRAQKRETSLHKFSQTGQGGKKVIEAEWDDACRRASGVKVLDDPKRLQKSIDDAFKLKARRAKKWQQRLDQQQEDQQQRQERRQKNLRHRSEQRKQKKEQRKAKKQGRH